MVPPEVHPPNWLAASVTISFRTTRSPFWTPIVWASPTTRRSSRSPRRRGRVDPELVADAQRFQAVRRIGRGYALPILGNFVTAHRRGAFVTVQEVTPNRTGMRLARLRGHRTQVGRERILRTCGVLALTRSTVAMWGSRSPGARGVMLGPGRTLAARVRRYTNADRRRDAPAWGATGWCWRPAHRGSADSACSGPRIFGAASRRCICSAPSPRRSGARSAARRWPNPRHRSHLLEWCRR